MKNRSWLQILFIVVSLPALSCSNKQTVLSETEEYRRSVEVYKILREEVRQEIEGFGNLSFRRKTDVTTAVDGTILKMHVEEGAHVGAFEQIGELFNIQLEIRAQQAGAALFQAESAYELAEIQYREGRLQTESRLLSIEKSKLNLAQKLLELEHQRGNLENERELLSIGGVTEDDVQTMELSFSALETEVEILKKDIAIRKIGFRDVDIISFGYTLPDDTDLKKRILIDINSLTLKSELKVAEARVRSAETECDSAEALLSETMLSTPIAGIVGARYMEEGERVSANDKLYTIFDSTDVDMIFAVPEEIGVLLETGQIVSVRFDAVKDREFKAEISRISPTIDTRSGNITVRAELQNDEGLFKPGMFSRFSLAYGTSRSMMRIPSAAFSQRDGNRAEVVRVSGGHAYPQSITIGSGKGGMYELENGLEEGDEIILNPSPLIREGGRCRCPLNPEQASS